MLSEPAVTEEINEKKNLPNGLFHFTEAELSTSDTDSVTSDGTPLRKRKRNIGMPRGQGAAAEEETEETSVPNPIPLATRDGVIRDRRLLWLAAAKGDWETTKSIIENDRKLVSAGLTREGDTVLHIAVAGKCSDFIRKLVDFLEPDEMLTVNINKETCLHIAAESGVLEVANLIVGKNEKLLLFPAGTDDLIPLAMAIQGGHREMVDYLYGCTKLDNLADETYIRLVLDSLSSKLYGTALELLNTRTTMAYERDKTGKTALHVLAQKTPKVPTVRYQHSEEFIVGLYTMGLFLPVFFPYHVLGFFFPSEHGKVNDYFKSMHAHYMKSDHPLPDQLVIFKLIEIMSHMADSFFLKSKQVESAADQKVLVLRILNLVMDIISDQDITDLMRTLSSVIFDAARSGNVQFLAVLLRRYPELLWEKDERGRSVFHVAVVYRQEKVFNLIYNTGAVKDYLVGIEDSDGNNMLHLAGMSSENKEKLGGLRANLLMQQELLWFKEVEKIARPGQKNKKNSKGMTPREVYIAEHGKLLREGEDAIKGTAKSCMLVATLVATIVFAAPLNVQGLNGPSKKLQSWIFAFSNAAALCTSISSIVTSLSILISSYARSDFVDSLHSRSIIMLTTLFMSIEAMVVAFGAAMFVIFDDHPPLFVALISAFAGLPVMLLFSVSRAILADLIRSYMWSKSLFKPSVHKIFV